MPPYPSISIGHPSHANVIRTLRDARTRAGRIRGLHHRQQDIPAELFQSEPVQELLQGRRGAAPEALHAGHTQPHDKLAHVRAGLHDLQFIVDFDDRLFGQAGQLQHSQWILQQFHRRLLQRGQLSVHTFQFIVGNQHVLRPRRRRRRVKILLGIVQFDLFRRFRQLEPGV